MSQSLDALEKRRELRLAVRACGPTRFFGEEGDPWIGEPVECPWCQGDIGWGWETIQVCPTCGRDVLFDVSSRVATGLISPADLAFLEWFYGISSADPGAVSRAWRLAYYQGMPRLGGPP